MEGNEHTSHLLVPVLLQSFKVVFVIYPFLYYNTCMDLCVIFILHLY